MKMILYTWGQILFSKEILLAPVALLLTTACEYSQKQICRNEGKYNVNEGWFRIIVRFVWGRGENVEIAVSKKWLMQGGVCT